MKRGVPVLGQVIVSTFLFRSLAATACLVTVLTPSQFTLNWEKLPLTEPALTDWVVQHKSKVNNFMLDETSLFVRTLRARGGLSHAERHLLSFHVDVRPLAGVKNMYGALFYSRHHQNTALIRVSLFQDGGPGAEKGELPAEDSPFLHESIEACRGLNLSGKALKEYFALADRAGKTLTLEERSFREQVLTPLFERHPTGDFFLLGANVTGFALDTFGHEVNHGLFSASADYRRTVTKFWNEVVSPAHQTEIRAVLGDIYVAADDHIIIDEFQAYLLQPKVPVPQSERLAKFVPLYYEALITALRKSGQRPAFLKDDASPR